MILMSDRAVRVRDLVELLVHALLHSIILRWILSKEFLNELDSDVSLDVMAVREALLATRGS